LEANQLVIVDNLHALTFSDIATSWGLLRSQLQLITSSQSSILYTGRELNNLPFESTDLAGARRADSLEVIKSPTSLIKQECRHACRCKFSEHRGPSVVELQPFNQPSFGFTDRKLFTSLTSTMSSSPTFFLKN